MCYKAVAAGSIPRRDDARDDDGGRRARSTATYDVAIVGAGYVGVPLAQVFADAGRSVVLVEVDEGRVEQLRRGESYIEDVSSEVLGELVEARPPRRDDRLRRAARRRRDPDRAADAALEAARARPLDRPRRRRRDRTSPAPGSPRRARVDDVPGHDAGGAPARARARVGARRRTGLPPRLLTRARRPGPCRLDDEDRPEGGGRDRRRVDRRRGRALRLGGRDDPPRLVARGRGADEAPREHLPLGQHRARQRARAALRPDGDRHLGGRGRGRDEAVRLHAVPARARASAVTASRSTPSTSPGRRASTTSRRGSSSSPARSTRTCRTTAARASRRRSTTARASRSPAPGSSCSASRTSRTSPTGASRPP